MARLLLSRHDPLSDRDPRPQKSGARDWPDILAKFYMRFRIGAPSLLQRKFYIKIPNGRLKRFFLLFFFICVPMVLGWAHSRLAELRVDGWTNVSEILRQGVYALSYRGTVVYVGQSKNMLVRVYTHKNVRKGNAPKWIKEAVPGPLFDEVHVIPCHPDRIDALEQQMIDRYKPRYNIRHKTSNPIGPVTIRVGDRLVTLGEGSALVTPTRAEQGDFVRRF